MASKREDQMAAKYAEVVERNKQLERQNAEYAAEIERLRSGASNNSTIGISKEELRQIISEVFASEKEIKEKIELAVKTADINVRNAFEFFHILTEDQHFKQFSYEVAVFREHAMGLMKALTNGCKEMSEVSKVKVTPEYKRAVSDMADKVVEGMNKKLMDATDEALKKVKDGSQCIVLSPDIATVLSYVWFVPVIGFVVSLVYNHCVLHAFGLFVIQYIFLGVVLVPWLISIITILFLEFRKCK